MPIPPAQPVDDRRTPAGQQQAGVTAFTAAVAAAKANAPPPSREGKEVPSPD